MVFFRVQFKKFFYSDIRIPVSGEGDGPRTGAGLAEDCLRQSWWSDQKKSMLVWDSFRAHLSPPICNTLKSLNTESTVTSMLHPLNVTVNKPFKDCMRKKWQEWMLAGQNTFTASGHLSEGGTGSDLLVDSKAWEDILNKLIKKWFCKCCTV
ncbi:Pogo transposable element with KRAB domain [Acropora cervicornis]|uniref:Pogo transposable element with KRAB domain n=1 Tax=Acropora cervicornis TaxID=6130 RepID=A0AAD9QED3_ACRCE|nr:Pogo transposable element with KRAB domain [Acropora cervicornis]